jgi:hypothetical protein
MYKLKPINSKSQFKTRSKIRDLTPEEKIYFQKIRNFKNYKNKEEIKIAEIPEFL